MIRLSLVALGLALAGCGLLGGGSASSVEGRTFLSTGVTVAGAPMVLVAGTQIRLSFTKDGSIGAQAGCNSFGGTYRLDGAVLRIDGGGMTEMGCDPDRMAQDDWLFGFLGGAPTISVAGNELILRSGDTVITLLDREIAEPDLPLVGTLWTVTTVFVASDAGMGMSDVTATLVFNTTGQITFNTGCNQGGGRYVVDGALIHFSDLAMTKRACEGDAGQLEAAVMATLNGDPVWSLDANSLTLHVANGERGLGLIGTPAGTLSG
ncbi:MAG TPA: META domain-containing protein [Candidatus Polarisedimenticolia bacterium]|nr:META domain-containing protein [Candidatus Polarisedimenticolia bacterium]